MTISELQPWNNNQSVYGKILEMNIETPSETDSRTKITGQIGDSTGVIDFSLIQRENVPTL